MSNEKKQMSIVTLKNVPIHAYTLVSGLVGEFKNGITSTKIILPNIKITAHKTKGGNIIVQYYGASK